MCSNPQCGHGLTALLASGVGYNIGEMAHVIAKNPGGPRGGPAGGGDTYQNLLLLCPTCHRMIDKAPAGEFPEQMLLQWKEMHEARIREIGKKTTFDSKDALWDAVRTLLQENRILWRDIGPRSNAANRNPGSNLYRIWNFRKLDTIVPNNRKIINYIEFNKDFLVGGELELFMMFKMHARAFENHQYDRTEDYPLFPVEFGGMFTQ